MVQLLPRALEELIETLGVLPGVGARTAERYGYFLLRASDQSVSRLQAALAAVRTGVKVCPRTFALIDAELEISPLYSDPQRDKTVVAVVEEPLDIVAIERTGLFRGTYHVLGGVISPIDGIGPEQLHIAELIARIKADGVTEVIMATNAGVEGESTALYVQKSIEEAGVEVRLTRLARGLPMGVDLEYADHVTLGHALQGRRAL